MGEVGGVFGRDIEVEVEVEMLKVVGEEWIGDVHGM